MKTLPEWMSVFVALPADDARALLLTLREKYGFRNSTEDPYELLRADGAVGSYGPAVNPEAFTREGGPRPSLPSASDPRHESGSEPPA